VEQERERSTPQSTHSYQLKLHNKKGGKRKQQRAGKLLGSGSMGTKAYESDYV
jgi:hypothetical protein